MQTIDTLVKFVKLENYIENENNLSYATDGAACFDICSAINEPMILEPGKHYAIPTAIKTAPEAPIWFRVNSRSGLAIKHGIITIAGIIDTDYRGEWMIGLFITNSVESGYSYTVNPGYKIAQVEVPFPYKAVFEEVSIDEFDKLETQRGEKGFGSSGK